MVGAVRQLYGLLVEHKNAESGDSAGFAGPWECSLERASVLELWFFCALCGDVVCLARFWFTKVRATGM